jgi:hypothetical protein
MRKTGQRHEDPSPESLAELPELDFRKLRRVPNPYPPSGDDRPVAGSASRRGRESDAPPGDRMLGPDALTSGMSLDDWNRYIVTRMYMATGRNQSETARRLGISWRRAGQWIDHTLLARWAAERAP